MPYANNNGVRIYYEVEGDGPPVVFLHGFSGGLETWRERGYAAALNRNFRLILLDIRAHGRSDKPHLPEDYLVERFVGDVEAVLDDLGMGSAHCVGYSAGGSIALCVAKALPGRVTSMVILAASPKRDSHDAVRPFIQALAADPQAVIRQMEQAGPLPDARRKRLLANDYEALLAVMALPKASVEADLPKMTMPFLIFLGEADQMVPFEATRESYKSLPNATVVSLPGVTHEGVFNRTDLVLPHIKQFLAQVVKAS